MLLNLTALGVPYPSPLLAGLQLYPESLSYGVSPHQY